MITVESLQAVAEAQGTNITQVAHDMITARPWALSMAMFKLARWEEIAKDLGVSYNLLTDIRPALVDQFHEKCAAAVRRHFNMPDPN